MPAMMFIGNLNYVADRRGRRAAGGVRGDDPRRRAGVHPVLAPVHPAADPGRRRWPTCCSPASPRPSGCSSCSTRTSRPRTRPRRRCAREPLRPGRVRARRRSATSPDKPLIEDLSLVAEPGQTVAIVGPTGAGKTTLVNLLMRFYELDGGRITLDGVDIADDDRGPTCAAGSAWCCRTPGCSAARSGTTSPTATRTPPRTQILAAARATYVDRFVRTLPDGYDTVIDEEGSNVSAGEKQLITIARAFLADPALLILDEATSSVDTRTEVLVQRAMAALRSGPDQLRDRAPAVHDPRRRPDPGDGGRPDRRAGHPRRAARRAAAPTTALYNAQFAAAAEID